MMSCTRTLLIFLILLTPALGHTAKEEEIVFAVSPTASPTSNLAKYKDFIGYLAEKTGKKVIMKQRRKYSELNSLLQKGEAHFAMTCTGAYLSGRHDFGLQVLVVPVINGKTSYNSYIVVNKESKINDFLQLQGKVFAFTDPLSLSGRLYPLYLLNTLGIKPAEFFGKIFFTSSPEKAIESVAKGFADGAAVDSFIFEDMKKRKSPSIDNIKIIKISPSYGIPPVVVSPLSDKSDKWLMLKALINMIKDPAGREVLDGIQVDRFILPDPAIYHTAVKLRQVLLLP